MMKSRSDLDRLLRSLVKARVSEGALARRTGSQVAKVRAQLAGKAPLEEVVRHALEEIEREARKEDVEGR